MLTKSKLAIKLSKLETFSRPKLMQEQYQTDSEIASEILWFAYMQGDIEGKAIADLGAGTGILGIGCCLLGAKKCYMVEKDASLIEPLRKNIDGSGAENAEVISKDIKEFSRKADVVVQNPPFGTKTRHADREFLEKAFSTAEVIYSIHKSSTAKFVEAIARDNGFVVTHKLNFSLPLKATHPFHKRRIHRISVDCFRIAKNRKP